MGDIPYTIFLQERKAAALEAVLREEGVDPVDLEKIFQARTESYYEQMVSGVIREKIENEITAEDREAKRQAAAARRFAALRIIEDGQEHYFEHEGYGNRAIMARLCREYLREYPDTERPGYFAKLRMYAPIDESSFFDYKEFIAENHNVEMVIEINFDDGIFGFMQKDGEMHKYSMKDVSTAAYRAFKKDYASPAERENTFMDYLADKEIPMENPAPGLGMQMK